ncbi:MAG: hypothetical protein OEM78_14265 [Gammaproteobacteria bacterium]|nr:hypothetical protein [Gammaproteobacteria bacterium]
MRSRLLKLAGGLIGALILASLMHAPARAQSWVTDSVCPDDAHLEFHRCALRAARNYDPPRTVDGVPDMQGIWRRRGAMHESLQAHPRTIDDAGGTSGVVDPADGFVPIQDWAEAKRRYNRPAYVHHNAICRLSGVPVTMYMTGTYQFMQIPGTFFIQGEESHAFRTVPLDGRKHIGEDIKLWNGDSIGRWEGNALVIETRNQAAKSWLDQRGRFFTDEAVVTERFTMIDANTIHYQATIEDPNVFTRPFTIATAYRRSTVESFEVWEEACHENNDFAKQQFLNVGYEIYPGITGEEARRLSAAWDLEEAELEELGR